MIEISYSAMIGSASNNCDTTSGGVRMAAATKAMTIATLRFSASVSGAIRPDRTSNNRMTGNSNANPNAKIRRMISERYSEMRGSISMVPNSPKVVAQPTLEARFAVSGFACSGLKVNTPLAGVLTLADRIMVMYRGRVVGIVPGDTPRDVLGLMMAGEAPNLEGAAA